jgi:hypothetical protein
MREFAAISMNFCPRRIEGQPANSRTEFNGFADRPANAALDKRAALRLSRSKFTRIRRKRSAAAKTTGSKPFVIRCVARSSVMFGPEDGRIQERQSCFRARFPWP